MEPARRLFRFAEAAIQRILGLAEHPWNLQRLCSDVLNFKYTNNRRGHRITEEELMESVTVREARAVVQQEAEQKTKEEMARVTEPR